MRALTGFVPVVVLLLCCPSGLWGEEDKKVSPLVFPAIKGYGGIVAIPGAAHKPRRGTKVVVDITAAGDSGKVHGGLAKVARYVNLYGHHGLQHGKDFQLVVVLHGSATQVALKKQAYAKHTDADGNPSEDLIVRLRKVGVPIFVCGQALAHKHFNKQDVSSHVRIAVSAATLLINKQTDGFAYLPIH